MEQKKTAILSALVVNLLKGIIYRDTSPDLWQGLAELHSRVTEQASILGLDFILDENEGYAYFRQKDLTDSETDIPRLVQRRQLSYTASLLCVLLRKKLVEADSSGEISRVILTKEQIVDMVRLYMPDTGNEAKMVDRIETAIRRIVETGFLRLLDPAKSTYEVRRIIRAFVDAEMISSIDEKLESYRKHADEPEDPNE